MSTKIDEARLREIERLDVTTTEICRQLVMGSILRELCAALRGQREEIDRPEKLARELAANICLSCNRSAAGLWTTCEMQCDHRSSCMAALTNGEPAPTRTCRWTNENSYWDTSCGTAWEFTCDGPVENGVIYCHKCGLPVEVAGEGVRDERHNDS